MDLELLGKEPKYTMSILPIDKQISRSVAVGFLSSRASALRSFIITRLSRLGQTLHSTYVCSSTTLAEKVTAFPCSFPVIATA